MDNKGQKVEGPKEKEIGYTSIDGEFKLTEPKLEKFKSSTISSDYKLGNKEDLTSYHSSTGIYSTSDSNTENKNSKEGATFAEYPPTSSVGLKSTVNQPTQNKPNLTTSTGYNSMIGEYTSTTKIDNKESKEGIAISQTQQAQPGVRPLIVQVPSNAPILNKNDIQFGNIQGSVRVTSTNTTTTTTNSTGINPLQPPNVSQQMPFGQPLEGSTFAEYPQTVSHGIKSSTGPATYNQ